MIKEGMIVRYAKEWCSPGERQYLHVVKENRLNPVTDKMTRWLIETINTTMTFNPTQTVEDYMIEPTGFTIEDYMMQDKTMSIINAERNDYIEWLIADKGYNKEDAEKIADIMGY